MTGWFPVELISCFAEELISAAGTRLILNSDDERVTEATMRHPNAPPADHSSRDGHARAVAMLRAKQRAMGCPYRPGDSAVSSRPPGK